MKTFNFLYIAAAALLFAACANDNEQQGYNSPVAATITADISNNVNTRATAVENTWTSGDAIGVYATSNGITKADNKKYVTADANGNFAAADDANTIYFLDTQDVTFSAYYPYSESLTDGKLSWTMAEPEANKPCTADILYASGATASKASPNVNFDATEHPFKHCMSLVEFVVNQGEGVSADNTLQSVTLKNIYTQGTFNTTTGATEADGSRDNYTHNFGVSLSADAANRTFKVVMLPQSLQNNQMEIEVALKNGNVENTYKTTLTPSTDNQFKAGYKYTYKIQVNNTSITIENANIQAWTTTAAGYLDAELAN